MPRLAQLKQDKFWPFSMLPRPKSNQRRKQNQTKCTYANYPHAPRLKTESNKCSLYPWAISGWMKSLIFHSVYDLNTLPILSSLVEQRPKEIQLNWYDLLSPSMNPTILPLLSFSLVYKINQILSKDFHFPERGKGYILDNTDFASS